MSWLLDPRLSDCRRIFPKSMSKAHKAAFDNLLQAQAYTHLIRARSRKRKSVHTFKTKLMQVTRKDSASM